MSSDALPALAGSRSQKKRVTSIDVARECGVSQTTVARAFSTPHLVSPDTQERVRAAAKRLGYVPNAIARSLKSQRTNIIGAVVPAHGEYWQHVLTQFSQQLAEKGEQLLLFSFSEPARVDAVLETVEQYRVDGLILASSSIGAAQLDRMRQAAVPVVAFNQPDASGVAPSVAVDNEAGIRDLARHLTDLGCRRILFVGGVASASTDQIRYRGAAQELGARGVACPYLEAGGFNYDAGYKVASQIVELEPIPDAVMVASDEVAFGVIDGLKTAGIDVPGDMLITGFDGVPQASWAGYDLTTVVQATDVLVEKTIDLLLSQRDGADPGHIADVVVPGTIRFGRTTRRTHG